MFKIDDREVKKLEAQLKAFKREALPFATKATINSAAFETRKVWQRNIAVKMVERNRFTKASVRVVQSKTLNIHTQSARVGSIAPYMDDQEFGKVKMKRGEEGVSIATGYAAGQENAQPRTRLPRKANKLASIRLRKQSRKGHGRRQKNLIAVREAASSGHKFVFLDLGRRKGIFRVTGGKRRPSVKMVYDLTSTSVVIPKNPTLAPSVAHVQVQLPKLYAKALRFQLKRHGLFNT